MKLYSIVSAILFLVFGAFATTDPSNALELYDLKVEHLENPIQLDITAPRLSWKIRANSPSDQSIVQESYHILVASTRDQLATDKGDLWDSGNVASAKSVLVKYQGEALQSRQTCFWKVRVTDNKGRISGWSEVATWEMALLDPRDWSGAEWIGLQDQVRNHAFSAREHNKIQGLHPSHPSPLFRKEVVIAKPVKKARAYVSGIGYSEFYINGCKISDNVLDPGQTNYEQHTLYVVHDITQSLQEGLNALGFWLGNGFYGQNIAWDQEFGYGKPSLRAKVFVEYEDGSSEQFVTDTSWKATPSPVVFDNLYWGESYDARLEIEGWATPGLDDSQWQKVVILPAPCPDANLRPQLIPPIKVVEHIKPVEIRKTGDETYLVDFGKNLVGWIRITVDQNPGDVIKILPAEVLTKDRKNVDQRTMGTGAPGAPYQLYYICKGEGEASWTQRFVYTGFQYAEISGLTSAPTADTVEALFVRSAIEKTGDFSSSNELLNQQYAASILSLEGNWHSIPEDCPHREKCGWLGDAHATADLSLYNYDIVRFYAKYLRDIEDGLDLNDRGERVIPGTAGVPQMVAPGKRSFGAGTIDWAIAYLIIPWQMYLHTGDKEAFTPHFKHIQNFITYYQSFKNEQGVIDDGLGDWCPPNWDRKRAPEFMECHPFVSGTIFFYQALQITQQMADLMGEHSYADWCLEEATNIQQAFDNVYLKPIEGTDLKHYGSQTATVMALRHGMVADEDRADRVEALVYDINELHEGHHSCGIHGQRFLYTVLADAGETELVSHLLNDTTFPSPGFVLSHGLSTWPERRWNWDEVPFGNSFNHPMNGGFTAFMHESLGGIRPDTSLVGYKHFTLKPQMTDAIDWVKTSVESPYGPIRSEWKQEAAAFIWEVEIPANTNAKLLIPYTSGKTLKMDNQVVSDPLHEVTESGRLWLELEVGSGVYKFEVK